MSLSGRPSSFILADEVSDILIYLASLETGEHISGRFGRHHEALKEET